MCPEGSTAFQERVRGEQGRIRQDVLVKFLRE